MSTPEGGYPGPGDEDVADNSEDRAGYRQDLSDVVDDIEERVAEKHRSQAASGTETERTDTIPDDAGDEAPD